MKIKFFILLFAIFTGFATVNGMTTFVIQNKMNNDLYINSLKTNGTIVYNQSSLSDEPVLKGDSICVEIGVDSTDCDIEENYVSLDVFNKNTQEYEPVFINWDVNGVRAKKYMVKDFYRIAQQFDGGAIILTFYEDIPSVIEQLKLIALSKIRSNLTAQQQISRKDIARYCGGIDIEELNQLTQGK